MSVRVIVAGAGTGGLCLAQLLHRAGAEVVVLERDVDPGPAGLRGYRVGISPDGARALRACLPAELYAVFEASTAAPYDRLLMCTEQYRELLSLPFAELPGGGAEEFNVSRSTLRRVLLTGIEDTVRWGSPYVGHEVDDDGTVVAHTGDGDTVTGDLLVGADGAHSRVRGRFLPGAGLTSTGLVAIGGRAPLDATTTALLPSADGMALVFDRTGTMGISHVMRMPWDDDRVPRPGIDPDRAAALRGWPGLAGDPTGDFVSWGVTVSHTALPGGRPVSADGSALLTLAQRVTTDWDPRWRALLGRSDPASALWIDIRTSDPLPHWEPGPVTLLGDAAHTMTPGRGAGANTALRDARELGERLVRVHHGDLDLRTAVGGYEAEMRRYSAVAVRESLQQMHDDSDRGPVSRTLATAAQRTGLRLVNRVPALRRRLARGMQRARDSERA
ncbi:NAD(P)/FAD-dependent oxidoreductase [Pseudonocardia sp. ICBG1142]|uniref:FAD-dependent oxidoreductase n=1 Tax=Pseudonocardia sp. ICBG1142 TaxID=2846760 RepID=UPI001CF67984|nr:NAD(P)/FAD-dependent oxidoreductase [Pseudonocardia sp. ICBG1142]